MREERVILEEETDSAPLRWNKYPGAAVRPGLTSKVYDTVRRAFEAGQHTQNRCLAGTRWTKQDGYDRRIKSDPQFNTDLAACWIRFPKTQV